MDACFEGWADPLDELCKDRLFRAARSVRAWTARRVESSLLIELYQLMRMGPTAANCQPARIIFVQSPQEKLALLPMMDVGNREQTRGAPVTAILAYDLHFYEKLGSLYPHQPQAKDWFTHSPSATRDAALRNASLQSGYFIMAARALGLDCGPMGGFDADALSCRFFPDARTEVNFLCNLDYARLGHVYERLPRLSFEDACDIL